MSISHQVSLDSADQALGRVLLLQDQLDRIITRLKVHVATGMLDEGDRYAIRVLESRKRWFDRLYLSHYGTPEQQRAAQIELFLANDNGKIIEIGSRKHSVGHFGCRACDRDGDGLESKTLARLCPKCERGIQHAARIGQVGDWPEEVVSAEVYITVDSRTGAVSKTLEPQGVGSPMGSGVQTAPGSPKPAGTGSINEVQGAGFRRVWVCDRCGIEEERPE